MTKHLMRLAIFAAVLFAAASLYVYARFTVDDAFITWRYGKNLVSHGIWNYSPSSVDPTQAYTNPIFALLGIIPPALGWDVVFFFKIISLATYAAFFAWMIKISERNWLMTLLFLGLPATVVHTFSGLETVVYVFAVAALLVALHQRRLYLSLCLSLLLFITRPESWILVLALPAFWFFVEPAGGQAVKGGRIRRAAMCALILGLPLAAYFALHIFLFGDPLPNTFYAKSGAIFRPRFARNLLIYTIPLFFAFRRILWPLAALSAAFFGGMIASYTSSDLQMNYSERFSFHVFAPCYVFGLYILALELKRSKKAGEGEPPAREHASGNFFRHARNLPRSLVLGVVLIVLLCRFFTMSGKWPAYEATYYQRALVAHAALGKKISQVAGKYNIKSLSVGDAGMLPYQSNLSVLDNVGLGSARLTRGKPTEALFDSYELGMVIFYTKDGLPVLDEYRQSQILGWAEKKGFFKVGELYWQPDYMLAIYAKQNMPEIEEVCLNSRLVNSVPDSEMRWATLPVPPWVYWHE